MSPNDARSVARSDLTEGILDRFADFCAALLTGGPEGWLSVELTMPQIKVMMLIVTWGRTTGSRLARALGVGLPSVTRLVDRLGEHGFIAREEDPEDRRVTYIVPTPAARRLVENLQNYRREYLGAALASLDARQLEEVERGLSHLVFACRTAAADAGENAVQVTAPAISGRSG